MERFQLWLNPPKRDAPAVPLQRMAILVNDAQADGVVTEASQGARSLLVPGQPLREPIAQTPVFDSVISIVLAIRVIPDASTLFDTLAPIAFCPLWTLPRTK